MSSRSLKRVCQVKNYTRRAIMTGLAILCLALGTAEGAQLTLTWSDASTNEDGFQIQRSTGISGTFANSATVGAGITGYVDGTVTAGTTYCYRVSAYNAAGSSAYSNQACATAAVIAATSGAGSGTRRDRGHERSGEWNCRLESHWQQRQRRSQRGHQARPPLAAPDGGGCLGLVLERDRIHGDRDSRPGGGPQLEGCGHPRPQRRRAPRPPLAAPDGGDVSVWYLNGTASTGIETLARGVDPSWKVVGAADLNGDGHPDLLWQHQTAGDVSVWYLNGTASTGIETLARGVDPSWKVVGAADVNGDGHPDLLWQHQTAGDVSVWYLNGTASTGIETLARGVDPSWKVVGAPTSTATGTPTSSGSTRRRGMSRSGT